MRFNSYNIPQEIHDLFAPRNLVIYATILEYNVGSMERRILTENPSPALHLFDGITSFQKTEEGFVLQVEGKPTHLVVETQDKGTSFYFKKNHFKEGSTTTMALTQGNPRLEIVSVEANIAVVKHHELDLWTVMNDTYINGTQFTASPYNPKFNWMVDNVIDGDFGSLKFIATDSLALDRGKGRQVYCTITTDPNIPIARWLRDKPEDETVVYADYFVDPTDLADRDEEKLILYPQFGVKKPHGRAEYKISDIINVK